MSDELAIIYFLIASAEQIEKERLKKLKEEILDRLSEKEKK
jgi:hypothetical protein